MVSQLGASDNVSPFNSIFDETLGSKLMTITEKRGDRGIISHQNSF